MSGGRCEAGTIATIELLCGVDKILWDVGSWIGPLSLLALAKGSQVVTFDADPQALRALSLNVSPNPSFSKRIVVVPRVLSVDSGPKQLKAQVVFGDSMSSLVGAGTRSIRVEAVSADEAFETFPLPLGSVVKIDIEGGEYLLGSTFWRTLAERQISITLSTHPTILAPFYRVPSKIRLNRAIVIFRSLSPSLKILRELAYEILR